MQSVAALAKAIHVAGRVRHRSQQVAAKVARDPDRVSILHESGEDLVNRVLRLDLVKEQRRGQRDEFHAVTGVDPAQSIEVTPVEPAYEDLVVPQRVGQLTSPVRKPFSHYRTQYPRFCDSEPKEKRGPIRFLFACVSSESADTPQGWGKALNAANRGARKMVPWWTPGGMSSPSVRSVQRTKSFEVARP